jgi:hypothetical protein
MPSLLKPSRPPFAAFFLTLALAAPAFAQDAAPPLLPQEQEQSPLPPPQAVELPPPAPFEQPLPQSSDLPPPPEPMPQAMAAAPAPQPLPPAPAPLMDAPPAPALAPAAAPVPDAVEYRTPLIIVRFNQRNIYFEKALYNAVSKALSIKPDAMFDVALAPGLGSGVSQNNLDKVVNAMRKIGVPQPQIRTAQGANTGNRYDEVQIFVH